jgi:hypothetical protein
MASCNLLYGCHPQPLIVGREMVFIGNSDKGEIFILRVSRLHASDQGDAAEWLVALSDTG